MGAFEQIPLVGPGSELQLTLDGRAVPHLDVVRARGTAPAPNDPDAAADMAQAAVAAGPVARDGQITL